MGEARGGARRAGRAVLSRRTLRAGALLAPALTLACAPGLGDAADTGPPPAGAIWDVAAERPVDEAPLLGALRARRYVLLGEVHDNPEHHRLQARWLRGLARAGRRPAVVLEMVSADRAEALAAAQREPDVSANAIRDATAWESSGWPPFALYASIIEVALEFQLPIIPGNLTDHEMKILRRSGVAGLEPERRRRLALDAPSPPAQREALAAALRRGHCDLLPDDAIAAMVDVQRARDAQLARALVDAATRDGAVLIAGAQHVRRDVGVPFWLARLEPGASVVSVALRELPDGVTVARRVEPSEPARHDFVVWTGRIDRGDPCERLRGDP